MQAAMHKKLSKSEIMIRTGTNWWRSRPAILDTMISPVRTDITKPFATMVYADRLVVDSSDGINLIAIEISKPFLVVYDLIPIITYVT